MLIKEIANQILQLRWLCKFETLLGDHHCFHFSNPYTSVGSDQWHSTIVIRVSTNSELLEFIYTSLYQSLRVFQRNKTNLSFLHPSYSFLLPYSSFQLSSIFGNKMKTSWKLLKFPRCVLTANKLWFFHRSSNHVLTKT